MFRPSPGECPVCGAAHTTCTAGQETPITVVQTPSRDGADTPRLQAELVQQTLRPGSFTSGTYRGRGKAPRA